MMIVWFLIEQELVLLEQECRPRVTYGPLLAFCGSSEPGRYSIFFHILKVLTTFFPPRNSELAVQFLTNTMHYSLWLPFLYLGPVPPCF